MNGVTPKLQIVQWNCHIAAIICLKISEWNVLDEVFSKFISRSNTEFLMVRDTP